MVMRAESGQMWRLLLTFFMKDMVLLEFLQELRVMSKSFFTRVR